MFCIECKNEIVDCTCPDIEERLKKIAKNAPAASPAVMMNLKARQKKKEQKAEEDGFSLN